MKENVIALLKLGKIPDSDKMSDELFGQYENLLQSKEHLTFEEAESLIQLFSEDSDSDDCWDLNWGLLHLIESVELGDNIEQYRNMIARCNNSNFREILTQRLDNYIRFQNEPPSDSGISPDFTFTLTPK